MDNLRPDNWPIDRRQYGKIIVQFYNLFACTPAECLEDIPPEALAALSYMDYFHLIRPLIAEDLKNGNSHGRCAIRYRVSRKAVHTIATKYQIKGSE